VKLAPTNCSPSRKVDSIMQKSSKGTLSTFLSYEQTRPVPQAVANRWEAGLVTPSAQAHYPGP
jgi:hypothetical protein